MPHGGGDAFGHVALSTLSEEFPMSIRLSAVALVAAAFVPLSAHAADDSELRGIRAQLDQLKATYEGRIQALEAQSAGVAATAGNEAVERHHDEHTSSGFYPHGRGRAGPPGHRRRGTDRAQRRAGRRKRRT